MHKTLHAVSQDCHASLSNPKLQGMLPARLRTSTTDLCFISSIICRQVTEAMQVYSAHLKDRRSDRQYWPAAPLVTSKYIKACQQSAPSSTETHLIPRVVTAILAGCRKTLVEKVRRTKRALSMVFTGVSDWRFKDSKSKVERRGDGERRELTESYGVSHVIMLNCSFS